MTLSPADADRYARQIILREIGGAGQARLGAARVLVVGAGGIGSPALYYLAAAGVGRLSIIDGDAVALSNLQRQILFTTDDLGLPKADAAAAALHRLNPGVQITAHARMLTPEGAAALIGAHDLVLDGSDNFATRHLVADTCLAVGRTLVSAAAAEFQLQVATFKPHLRAAGGGQLYPCYRCLVPVAPPGDESCTARGIVGALAGIGGTLAALEAIKEITGAGDSLAGRMILHDGLRGQARTVRLIPDPHCPACAAPGAPASHGP